MTPADYEPLAAKPSKLLLLSLSAVAIIAMSGCNNSEAPSDSAATKTKQESTQTALQESNQDLATQDTQATKGNEIRIAAAANLSDVLPKIIDSYKADNQIPNQNIDITFASSGKLVAQIEAGAPYDIFLSADQDFPAKLAGGMLKDKSQPFTYTQGQLTLYSTKHALTDFTPESLKKLVTEDSGNKFTIANPELAPYGASAKMYLTDQQAYDNLIAKKQLIQAENIGQAFQYAHTGIVDYGFVALSQVKAVDAPTDKYYVLDQSAYPAILQDGIVVKNSKVATDFTNYLRSKKGQDHFAQSGYLPLK
ncbi:MULTISPECIES: molybdate ABC transporter substrate-binding protein [Psychrobacter]|uniref:molybdate ABC transporter substrate-binding protein n=1 Tax=Psychrobacter TaxID=497 RepID=UPI001CB70A6D|nr:MULTISPECIES: molybdate ABC transporter substrate-binding protein [Psychrobacter]